MVNTFCMSIGSGCCRKKMRINTQIRSVEATVRALGEGESIMPQAMFDGFDHTQYDGEVRDRWGDEAADQHLPG